MRIACLQLASEIGKPLENTRRADSLLDAASPEDLDLLVLPELAFSGRSAHLLMSLCLGQDAHKHLQATIFLPPMQYVHFWNLHLKASLPDGLAPPLPNTNV